MHRRRWLYWGLGLTGGLALLGVGLTRLHPPPLIFNLSASLPRGLYVVRHVATLERGMVVLVQPDQALEALLVARGYLPAGVPLLKPVVALGGDDVCVVDEEVSVNGTVLATTVADVDSAGRPLPQWQDCKTLTTEEVFLLSTADARSFDSRYFGPVTRQMIVGTATFLWGW
jgi:conjugative transfer signal peptidase TraF